MKYSVKLLWRIILGIWYFESLEELDCNDYIAELTIRYEHTDPVMGIQLKSIRHIFYFFIFVKRSNINLAGRNYNSNMRTGE